MVRSRRPRVCGVGMATSGPSPTTLASWVKHCVQLEIYERKVSDRSRARVDAASGRDAEAEDASGEHRVRDGTSGMSRAQESGPGSGRSVGTSRGRAENQGSVQSTFTHMVHLIHVGSAALHQDLRVTMCEWKYARWPHARCDDEVSVRCTGAAAGWT